MTDSGLYRLRTLRISDLTRMTTSISSEATMISIICLMLACWLLLHDEDNCQELNKKNAIFFMVLSSNPLIFVNKKTNKKGL